MGVLVRPGLVRPSMGVLARSATTRTFVDILLQARGCVTRVSKMDGPAPRGLPAYGAGPSRSILLESTTGTCAKRLARTLRPLLVYVALPMCARATENGLSATVAAVRSDLRSFEKINNEHQPAIAGRHDFARGGRLRVASADHRSRTFGPCVDRCACNSQSRWILAGCTSKSARSARGSGGSS